MKYIIKRASSYHIPCEEAEEETLTYIDERSISLEDMEKQKPNIYIEFMSKGENHKNIEGGCSRELENKEWVIEEDRIEDCFNKYGRIIVDKSYYKEVPIEITIYDDYIE